MLAILSVTFPFFALVAAGYAAARLRLLPLDAIPGLNAYVLFFALPAMLYRFGANTPLAQLLDAKVALLYVMAATVMLALVIGLTRRRHGWNDAAFGGLVAAFPNTGFMGVPLLLALLGDGAVGPIMLLLVIDLVGTTSLCIALSRLGTPGGAGTAARLALAGVLRNPIPWAVLLGAAASALAWQWPKPVTQTIALLADTASPVALFTIGTVLARSQMRAAAGHAPATPLKDYVPVALAKLLLHPALVWGLCAAAAALGAGLEPLTVTTLVLMAALPSASNVSMLAERYGADNGRIARIIMASTAAAFFSFPAIVALLK